MERDRVILHSDLNSFYASVETMLDPSLRGKAVAVCGDTGDRHGIVLAKSDLAKRAGVRTGMANCEAKRLCPELLQIPPRHHIYEKYSKLTRAIYMRYSPKVEPFGMDECWIDMTDGVSDFEAGERTANEIRNTVREELGLTVSVGVSFNKVFAKLGSDMKKPDAVTVIAPSDVESKVWTLPAAELLFVGRATERKLKRLCINTIGDIARSDPEMLYEHFGKNGLSLWTFAAGRDRSEVADADFSPIVKSVGHGITCREELTSFGEAERLMVELSEDVGSRLRGGGLRARSIQISVKDEDLSSAEFQRSLHVPSQSSPVIARGASELFLSNYDWHAGVRAITVRAIELEPEKDPLQLSIFADSEACEKRKRADMALDEIRRRFGTNAINPASVLLNTKLPRYDVPRIDLRLRQSPV